MTCVAEVTEFLDFLIPKDNTFKLYRSTYHFDIQNWMK
jgi:hypothetical protein